MGGTKQLRLADTAHGAAMAPIIHQRETENILADTLDHHPLGSGRAWKIYRLGLEARERRFRQADRELVNAVESRM